MRYSAKLDDRVPAEFPFRTRSTTARNCSQTFTESHAVQGVRGVALHSVRAIMNKLRDFIQGVDGPSGNTLEHSAEHEVVDRSHEVPVAGMLPRP